jgi:L-iditol 2-dehydrogenase
VHCCGLGGNIQGKFVAIFGAGPIGLLCCAVARAFGAATVIVVDVLDSRLQVAKSFGASQTYKMQAQTPDSNAIQLLAQVGREDGIEIVIDATGAELCIDCGVSVLKRGGTFIHAGLGSPRISSSIGQICDKEAVSKGRFRYGPGDYKLAIELLSSKRISLAKLITHEYPFLEAETAYENVKERHGIKTIIGGPGVAKSMASWISTTAAMQP